MAASTTSRPAVSTLILQLLGLALAFTLGPALPASPAWGPIDKAELADNTPKIDPEAGAEILLREGMLDRSTVTGTEDRYYVRAKIYNQRGIKYFSLFRIPYEDHSYISSISARTIKPDGTTIELTPKDFHERDVIKSGELRVKTMTFAFQGLEPGAVVEFRYTQLSTSPNWFVPMIFQDDLPSRVVRYRLNMLRLPPMLAAAYDLRAITYNCPGMGLKPDSRGFYHFEMVNLPAYKTEPFQESKLVTRASMVVYFTEAKDLKPDEYWKSFSKELHKQLESAAKGTKIVTSTLTTIVAPTDSEEDKLRKIYDYCRTKIVNRDRNTTHFTREQQKQLKENETATDTLKRGNGTGHDVNLVFAALARAAGIDVRLAACNDRLYLPFNPKITEPSAMFPHRAIAVRTGDFWRCFVPGSPYLPFGCLLGRHCDTAILIGDPKGASLPLFVAGNSENANLHNRNATFSLLPDGSLTGDVTETFTGLEETWMKSNFDGKTPEKCAQRVRRQIVEHLKQARVSSIVVENQSNPLAPLRISYHLNIPNYADQTPSRLFFQPAVFEKGEPPLFEAKERRNPIDFAHRGIDQDEIHFSVPQGYSPEEPSVPDSFTEEKLGAYHTSVTLYRKTGEIVYKRILSRSGVYYPRSDYATIKAALDRVHAQDGYTLTLKRNGAANVVEETVPKLMNEPATPDEAADAPDTDEKDD